MGFVFCFLFFFLCLFFGLIVLQKVILKLDVSDEKSKQKAMSSVSSLAGT